MHTTVKICFLGTRGIPSCYSGFETFVEELAPRLLKRGFDITVFSRTTHIRHPAKFFKGVKIIGLPSIPQKHLDTIFHTFLSLLYCIVKEKPDTVYICGVGNAPLLPIARLFFKTVINVDGQDWKRKKWGKFASFYLLVSEFLASKLAWIIVADAQEVSKYYKNRWGRKTVFIPYGPLDKLSTKGTLLRLGLQERGYILAVGRLVPENNFHIIIEGFKIFRERTGTDLKLVIVGNAPYTDDYKRKLFKMADRSIIFTGYLFGRGYKELSSFPYAYVIGAEVGGTHPVLVEQMGFGNFIISLKTASNEEVLKDAGIYFDGTPESLAEKLLWAVENPGEVKKMRKRAENEVRRYNWEKIVDEYSKVLR